MLKTGGKLKIKQMKIVFPDPDDFVNDIPGFLDQMELCIYHARKSAEKILAKYSEADVKEGKDTPWIQFNLGLLRENAELNKAIEDIDPDMEIENHIELEIVES